MKYIDAEKLIKSVNNYQEGAKAALNPIDGDADYYKGKIDACKDIQEFITSLQQEQQEKGLDVTEFCRPINPGIAKCVADHWWKLLDGKDTEEKQLEVDLAEEITRFFSKNPIPHEHITDWPLLKNTAIHFYELGLRARKEK